MSRRPSPSTPTRTTRKPRSSSALQGWSTAGCSTALVMTVVAGPSASATPKIALLSLSLPQLVKTISPGSQRRSAATFARAASMSAWTRPPNSYMLEALPQRSVKNGIIASTTSGAGFVVALLSR